MAKRSKKNPPHGDKYANKASQSQTARKQLDSRWEKPQQELNKQARGSRLMNDALDNSTNEPSAAVQLLHDIFANHDD